MPFSPAEIIIVRSLTESDLGLFAEHRAAARGRQRAININSDSAKALLAPTIYQKGDGQLDCRCVFGEVYQREKRRIRKSHKNWRLGGAKIAGEAFSVLDSKDFMLLRSPSGNDGSHPVLITFVSRKTDRVVHAGIAAIVEAQLVNSMALFRGEDRSFSDLAVHCGDPSSVNPGASTPTSIAGRSTIPPMPRDPPPAQTSAGSVAAKLRTPHLMERMLKAAADLSAPAQVRFLRTVGALAEQLRMVLIHTNCIVSVERDHAAFWKQVAGNRIGFVDGGLANLSTLGSVPVAARVGGYTVVPGRRGDSREDFAVLKLLIDELYADADGGIYDDSFPDHGALRDAARISIEAAGAVQMLARHGDLHTLLVHGALVNPVSRYSDLLGEVRHKFPDFSDAAMKALLTAPATQRTGRNRNFISVHLRQLELLRDAAPTVCGVVERESTTTSVAKAVLESLKDHEIADILHEPPDRWKKRFLQWLDPAHHDDVEGARITDPLLFRCVLNAGEALRPVEVDRNEIGRAPNAWLDVIARYPKPWVSYLQVSEWSAPIRLELFEKQAKSFDRPAELVMHCALLLPRYAFPVGLDIVDKFARIPNWMSKPVNTAVVRAMKIAVEEEDTTLFQQLRTLLCGSGREFLLRPGILT